MQYGPARQCVRGAARLTARLVIGVYSTKLCASASPFNEHRPAVDVGVVPGSTETTYNASRMALEDTVTRSSEKLLARLRDESQPDGNGFVSELLTAAANERQSALEEARRDADQVLTQRVEEVRTEAEAQIATEVARAETLAAARADGVDRVLAGIGRLDGAPGLSQALDVLADVAGQVAERAAVLTLSLIHI